SRFAIPCSFRFERRRAAPLAPRRHSNRPRTRHPQLALARLSKSKELPAMNYYALMYELVDDMVNRRVPFREEHLRLARESRERGELVLAGALSEPVDRALLVFLVDDKSKVESFARKDPYVINGLAKKWEVRPWNVVVGNEPQPASRTTTGTILRRWTARTTPSQLPKYLEHFSKNVVPELRRVPGYLGAG